MDTIRRFLFKDLNIRGQHVELDQAWQKMIEDRHYPAALQTVLGELTAMVVMLAHGLKHAGKVTIQVQGKGPVNLLMVEATDQLHIRGIAKTNQPITDQTTLDELLGDGQILVTMENTQTGHFFQSYVPREANSIAQSFEFFLSQSEQQPSKLWLAANEKNVSAVMIQKMPTTDEQDEDGWDRVLTLASTVTDEELCQLDAESLLHRLFHEETVELFNPHSVSYHCPHDRQRVANMLLSLGEAEVRKILAEEGEVVIHNEVCNVHFRFNEDDIRELFGHSVH